MWEICSWTPTLTHAGILILTQSKSQSSHKSIHWLSWIPGLHRALNLLPPSCLTLGRVCFISWHFRCLVSKTNIIENVSRMVLQIQAFHLLLPILFPGPTSLLHYKCSPVYLPINPSFFLPIIDLSTCLPDSTT